MLYLFSNGSVYYLNERIYKIEACVQCLENKPFSMSFERLNITLRQRQFSTSIHFSKTECLFNVEVSLTFIQRCFNLYLPAGLEQEDVVYSPDCQLNGLVTIQTCQGLKHNDGSIGVVRPGSS